MPAAFEPKAFEPIKGLHLRALADPRIVERIRVLDHYCLPVRYSEKYYETYVRKGLHQYNQLAYFHDILVGCITCRLEQTKTEGEHCLYIMTITVLEPYRRLGIGSRLLQRVLENAHADTHTRITSIALHMQAGSPVQKFYQNFNFETLETVRNYYSDLEANDALLLSLPITQAHFAHGGKKGDK